MIPAINLLPWRDGRRRRRNRLFGLQLGGAFVAAWALIGSVALHLEGLAEGQRERNDFLQAKVSEFDGRVDEVERLRRRRRDLDVRIDAVRSLEARRGTVVRLLEEIANTLPVGAHYQAMELRGDVLALRGVASSNQDVSALMRSLQESPRFAEPRLLNIKEVMPDDSPEGGSAFSMTVVRVPSSAAPGSGPALAASVAPAGGR